MAWFRLQGHSPRLRGLIWRRASRKGAQPIISTDLDWAKTWSHGSSKDLVPRMGSADRPREHYSKLRPPAASIDNAATTMDSHGFILQIGPGKPHRSSAASCVSRHNAPLPLRSTVRAVAMRMHIPDLRDGYLGSVTTCTGCVAVCSLAVGCKTIDRSRAGGSLARRGPTK